MAMAASAQLTPEFAVRLIPGNDIQAAVSANPPGTTFTFLPGVYRMQQITPKTGDTFSGKGSVTLNGSTVLTFTPSASSKTVWVASATATHLGGGQCAAATPLCNVDQDLFIDDVLQTPVASQAAMVAGSWYFDRSNGKVYVPANPAGHTVELGMSEFAFGGIATGVVVQYLTIEKYANPAQEGVVGGDRSSPGLGSNWTASNLEVRWNHGEGIQLGTQSKILKSDVHHNGQLGVGFYNCLDCLLSGTEIAFNNYAGFASSWEAGGSKFWATTNLEVEYNYVHDNDGPGLWSDYDNVGTTYEHNDVENNVKAGIKHEASYNAIIRSNTLKGNGALETQWVGNGQILLMNSQNVEMYSNVLEVPPARGGIAFVNQANRGSGKLGPFVAANNYAHNNTITYLGAKGMSGLEDDAANGTAVGNLLDLNRYLAPADVWIYWLWPSPARIDLPTLQTLGQEVHGKLILSTP